MGPGGVLETLNSCWRHAFLWKLERCLKFKTYRSEGLLGAETTGRAYLSRYFETWDRRTPRRRQPATATQRRQ